MVPQTAGGRERLTEEAAARVARSKRARRPAPIMAARRELDGGLGAAACGERGGRGNAPNWEAAARRAGRRRARRRAELHGARASPPAPRHAVVVFGATGFTGAHVAAEVLAAAGAAGLAVGLAGRDGAKLAALAARLPGGGGAAVLGGVDVADGASLARMAGACRLLLNCVGPYRCAARGGAAAS